MKIKLLCSILLSLVTILTGCNHDYEPPTETQLLIYFISPTIV